MSCGILVAKDARYGNLPKVIWEKEKAPIDSSTARKILALSGFIDFPSNLIAKERLVPAEPELLTVLTHVNICWAMIFMRNQITRVNFPDAFSLYLTLIRKTAVLILSFHCLQDS